MTSTVYTAKVSATMTIECVCEKCNEPYSYKIKIIGDGSTTTSGLVSGAEAAKAEAIKLADMQLQKRLQDKDFDANPCPHCEYVQSWQIEAKKASDAQVVAGCTSFVALLVLGIPFVIYINNKVLGALECISGIGILLVVGLVYLAVARIAKFKKAPNDRVEQKNTPSVSWAWDERYEGYGDMINKAFKNAFSSDKDEQ